MKTLAELLSTPRSEAERFDLFQCVAMFEYVGENGTKRVVIGPRMAWAIREFAPGFVLSSSFYVGETRLDWDRGEPLWRAAA